jgi:CRP-like cAMP-binding protein
VLDEPAPEAHQNELEQLRAQSRHVFQKGAGSMQHFTVPPLSAQQLFQYAGDAVVALAERTVHYRTFKAHDIVSRQGDKNSPLILVISGQLQAFKGLEDGREIGISLIGPGESCGHCAIIQDTPAVSSVAAVTGAVVGVIGRAEARRLFRAPGVAQALLEILSTRMNQAITRQAALVQPAAYGRVYAVLDTVVQETADDALPLIEFPSQSAIAVAANVSRETVSRAIGSLARCGVIVKDGRRLRVRDRNVLATLAAGTTLGL